MLNLLLNKVKSKKIITPDMFIDKDIFKLLDLRDEIAFDSAWMTAFYKVEGQCVAEEIKSIIDKIRECSFLCAYDASNSDEIASCVSDDFELLTKCYILGVNDFWLNSVILSYSNHIFPCGIIKPVHVSVDEAIKQLVC